MNAAVEPLVSVVTPVYNGAQYLVECIESVLAQTYHNWEFIIVDNCSTDETPRILRRYAQQDNRIKVVRNTEFVGVIENHNIAFRLMSQGSRYCKVVSADDYLFPECIGKLVEVAERDEQVAIVGSYAVNKKGIHWIGLPAERSVFAGRDVCRLYLLGAIEAFGTPSTVLYRSALVRASRAFYPGSLPNADLAACLACLEYTEFAFVHQILSYERIHSEAISADVHALNGFLTDRLQFLCEYGPTYLRSEEINDRREELLRELYRNFAVEAVNLRGKEYWNYHRRRLEAIGYPISNVRMAVAVCAKLADLVLNPKQTVEKVLRRRRTDRGSPFGKRKKADCLFEVNRSQGTGI
jgi:glycosyltransferase involved in cell wall biosynthesis